MNKRYILTFGSSNSSKSINKQLAQHAGRLISKQTIKLVDLRDFDLPIYSPDLEQEIGIPANASKFSELIEHSSGIILSLAEHNGSYTAVFKNIFDWMSRIDQKVWKNKPMLLLATSPGRRGGSSVLTTAVQQFPHFDGNIVAHFSLPSFHSNFSENGIEDTELSNKFNNTVELYNQHLAQ